jgi:hypothetical protein
MRYALFALLLILAPASDLWAQAAVPAFNPGPVKPWVSAATPDTGAFTVTFDTLHADSVKTGRLLGGGNQYGVNFVPANWTSIILWTYVTGLVSGDTIKIEAQYAPDFAAFSVPKLWTPRTVEKAILASDTGSWQSTVIALNGSSNKGMGTMLHFFASKHHATTLTTSGVVTAVVQPIGPR